MNFSKEYNRDDILKQQNEKLLNLIYPADKVCPEL